MITATEPPAPTPPAATAPDTAVRSVVSFALMNALPVRMIVVPEPIRAVVVSAAADAKYPFTSTLRTLFPASPERFRAAFTCPCAAEAVLVLPFFSAVSASVLVLLPTRSTRTLPLTAPPPALPATT